MKRYLLYLHDMLQPGFGDWKYSHEGLGQAEQRGLRFIGAAFLEARVRAGISQRKLEELTGVHRTTISKLENGKLVSLRLVRLAALANALDGLLPPTTGHAPWSRFSER